MLSLIKKHKNIIILAIILCLVNGCSSTNPFKETILVSEVHTDPVRIKESFKSEIPIKCQVLNSISFEHYFQTFYSLGYLSLNLEKDSFSLVALDPAGVRLFQLEDNRRDIKYSTPIEELEKLTPYVKNIAGDIRNIYFNNTPSGNASILKKNNKIVFSDLIEDKKAVFIFGGKNNRLLSKKFLKKRKWFWRLFLGDYYTVWFVSYHGYKLKNGKLYPINIFYKNNKFEYTLAIRLKEII